MSKTDDRMKETLRRQALGIVQMAARTAKAEPDKTADAVSVIEGQVNVLRDLGFGAAAE